ncbi:Alpha/Beta hydrolase protein [Cladorrhinum sp. PSN332]|nr:Alpha/Beta hydrolase protein [Cladorrhinum sp. PSN332]
MSELQKKWAKARLDHSMHAATVPEFENEEEDQFGSFSPATSWPATPQDDDSSSASSVSSTGTVIPSPGRALFARPQGIANRSSLDPIPWTTYFERELFLPSTTDPSITHHIYLTSPAPPSSSSSSSSSASSPSTSTSSSSKPPLFVLHHGAGSSGLSFCLLTQEIRKRLPTAGILSIDARGHGLATATTTDDLSLATLSSDLHSILSLTQQAMSWPDLPPLILVGHSLGGAVVTHLASSSALLPSLLGYAVLDVVEGSAMDALQSMHTYLATRPTGFVSLKEGIEWHVRSRTIRNAVSARASVPGLLVESKKTIEDDRKPWKWRTDLGATQPFWEGWFVGLSKKFLSGKGGKLLLLAGTDRLDTELTIGQMQGKYALQVFPEAGHFIHEDLPEKTAISLVDFYRRNDRSAMVLPPKVSQLLAQGKRV